MQPAILAPLVALATTLLTLAGMVYLLLALFAARGFRREPPLPPPAAWPTISVVKPVKGSDPHRLEAFRSMCLQQYPGRFELVLGMAEPDDAQLLADIAHLQAEFPNTAVRAVPCPERLGNNGKVSTLLQAVPHALGDVLVINDADILAGSGYLAAIATALAQPGVGFVTAPYVGRTLSRPTVWARLEALGITSELLAGVFTARMMDRGVKFGLGSTLALRRGTLDEIGGLSPLLDRVADDYELGLRVSQAGHRVLLLQHTVQTSVPNYTAAQFWQHQLRWWRTVRDARPWSYFAMVTSYALPWAVLNVVACGFALPSITLLSLALLLRVAVVLNVGVGILRDGDVLRDLMLLPVRDFTSLLLWACSYGSDTVVWRGEHFRLERGGMVRLRR